MKILVCVKQVPGTNKVEVDPVTGVLKRSGVKGKLNPYDLYAVEAALQMREAFGGEVSTLSMGPPQAKEALMETVYMGTDGGTLVSDRRVAGSDVLATAYALSQAIRKLKSPDIIICGKQTTDGDTAQVGAETAELLGIPHAANVLRVLDISKEAITVELSQEHILVTQQIPLPCLLCMDGDINTPRLPSYKRKKRYDKTIVRTMTLDDFDDKDENHYGLAGSATQVERIFPPVKNSDKQVYTGTAGEVADQLFALLKSRKYI